MLFFQLCSFGGVWVGQLGLKSARSVELEEIKKYVKWLSILAFFSVTMRIAWVFDMIAQVKQVPSRSL